jgi:hypothetical protein
VEELNPVALNTTTYFPTDSVHMLRDDSEQLVLLFFSSAVSLADVSLEKNGLGS